MHATAQRGAIPDGLGTPLDINVQALALGIVETIRGSLLILDGDLRVQLANDAFCSTFQLTRDAIAGRLLTEIDNGAWNIPPLTTLLHTILPEHSVIEDYYIEHPFTRTGTKRLVINAQTLHYNHRDTSAILLSIEDVTEKHAALKSAEQAHSLSEAILATVREPLVILDASFHVRTANASFYSVFRASHDETVGKVLFELGNGQWNIPSLKKLLQEILPDNTHFDGFEVEHDFPSIGRKIMLLNARKVCAWHGIDELILLAIEDITERKEFERALLDRNDALARSNAELERFAYVASHDLQEPLRMVSSFTQLLARKYKSKLGGEADQYISFAVGGAQRMQHLINDLLAYSRVGASHKQHVAVDCSSILHQVLLSLDVAIKEGNGSVIVDPMPVVNGDPVQIGQVFQNLIGNGIKFRRDVPPLVHVSAARRDDGMWEFCVKDNGIGIDNEYFERLFIIFRRLHTAAEYPGTGIGLAICKKIIEQHGGRIWVASRPGEGSVFSFTLPGAKEEA